VRNNPIYATAFTNISNLTPLYYIFNHIYTKNLFNLKFILLNRLIKSILTFIDRTLLILTFKTTLLPYN